MKLHSMKHITRVLLLLLALTAASACVSSPSAPAATASPLSGNPAWSADQYLEQGMAYSASGSYKQAIDSLTQCIRLNPDLDKAYFERGKAYSLSGDWQKARSDAAVFLSMNPQSAAGNFLLGIILLKQKEYEKAMPYLDHATGMEDDSAAPAEFSKLAGLLVPVNEILLLNAHLTSKQTGICAPGTCYAPTGYDITLRFTVFANPGSSKIQIQSLNIDPNIGWLSKIDLNYICNRAGVETMATNVPSANPVQNKFSCSLNYKTPDNSGLKISNTYKN
jgi:tetratricopeptide (TPR) repeat protein